MGGTGEVDRSIVVSSATQHTGSAEQMHSEGRCTRFLERLLGRLKHAVEAEVRLPAHYQTTAISPPLRGTDGAPPFPLRVQVLGWRQRLQLLTYGRTIKVAVKGVCLEVWPFFFFF